LPGHTTHPTQALIACHECDLLQRQPASAEHANVLCHRCGATLYRNVPDSANRTVALSIAGIILFVIANIFPFLTFEIGAQATQTTLFTGIHALYLQGIWPLSALIFFTCIAAPAIQLILMLYVFVPIRQGKIARYTRTAFRMILHIKEWNMIEVFMIGILVALVKLTKMAHIVPGIAMWSFMALIFVITGAAAAIDGRIVWHRLEQNT